MNTTAFLTRRHALIATCAALSPALGRSQAVLPDMLRMIMPFPPGNALDASARWFAEAYRTVTGRNAIVENKPGAAATIASAEVSRSKPDGSVVLFTTAGHLTTAVLVKKIPYDPIDGFTPVTPVAVGEGFIMVTRAGSRFNSVQDVLEAAKKAPGKISYASAGNGNSTHVVGALFAKSAGVDLLHVPYRGDFMTDLLSGVVDMMFVGTAVVKPFVDSNKLKALGITGDKRAASFPQVPTFAEVGVKDVDLPSYVTILAPPNMPPTVLSALHDGFARTLREPGLAAKFKSNGMEPWILPPDQFKTHMRGELAHLQRVLPPLGIQMDI
ncbi:tripartite tricarboxylate transporter substrate binding protein [Variovorax guangxiensis]|uniref:Bug family tripartite tricarboxylate transporter substrate binding protein n=1 Tax=Variovorax guangxiensis TaxID=1775474 RepID=UPI002856E7BA|nr:tripartite tricarboxylate transporter substrate binding protein [Variovorax guangxiensis]MDR6861418.1 tripartite-type tricarboxylate transporter receptor subunit TctC [Variovorax guangxiensis]